jgi:4-hydroxybenzoate polyprenyltransferase
MGTHIDNVLVAPNRRDVTWYHGWIRLFRLPNLLTVPGDQTAGFCLAGGLASGRVYGLACAMGAGLCLYAAGLATNDLADTHEDVSERPWRPLATGLLNRAKVEWVVVLLLMLALFLGALQGLVMLSLVAMLMATVLAYNLLFKRVPVLGELLMGACRAMSLLLGSVAAMEKLPFPDLAWLGASATMSYVVAVSLVARNEIQPQRLTWLRWLPVLVCFCWTLVPLVMPAMFQGLSPLFLVPFLAVGLIALLAAVGIGRHLQPVSGVAGRRQTTLRVSGHVGSMIRALILVQAMLVLVAVPGRTGWWIASAIALMWIPSTWLGRSIPSS